MLAHAFLPQSLVMTLTHAFACAPQAPNRDKLVARLQFICEKERVKVDKQVGGVMPAAHTQHMCSTCTAVCRAVRFGAMLYFSVMRASVKVDETEEAVGGWGA